MEEIDQILNEVDKLDALTRGRFLLTYTKQVTIN